MCAMSGEEQPPARDREGHPAAKDRFGLRHVPGTTIAMASLAILGAAALVGTPLWLWYRHKRKRADALARQPAPSDGKSEKAGDSR